MKKILLIVAVVVAIGVVGSMFASTASAQYFRIPMAPVIVGAGCCAPVCGPVYVCPPPCKAAAPAKSKAAPKKEKKEKSNHWGFLPAFQRGFQAVSLDIFVKGMIFIRYAPTAEDLRGGR